VRVLIAGLPPDAALFRKMEGMGGWTITDHLLASVVDSLGTVAYNALLGPHVDPKKLRGVKPPQPMDRPSTTHQRRERRKATSEDLKRMFGGGAAYRPKEVGQ
jgi:hypothetical protein